MLQNGQTHFKNLAVFTPQDFYSMCGHFTTFYMKRLIVFVKTVQWCDQSSSNIHNGTSDKNSKFKTLTILTKRLIKDAWLSPGPASAG